MSPTSTPSRLASGTPRARADIDPRISARRSEVTRQQGRRRLRLVGGIVAAVVVLFGIWSLLHSSLFSARAVTVVGATHESTAQIDVHTVAAASGLERLPWVRSASVSVHWPDGVRVEVTEQVPQLVMSLSGGRWAELSGAGRVLAIVAERPAGLLLVSGPLAAGAPGSSLGASDQIGLKVAATLPVSFRAQVTAVTVEPASSGAWVQLTMTTPVLVDIGDATQLRAKYEDVTALLAHATLHNGDIIDVSVPKAPTVTGP
jgi:cell division septal protein FtsQ